MSRQIRRRILQYAIENASPDSKTLARDIGVTETDIKRQLDILQHDKLIQLVKTKGRTIEEQKYSILEVTPLGWKALEAESHESDLEYLSDDSLALHARNTIPSPPIVYDVFLSYASADQQEANSLYEAILQARGKIFLAAKTLKPGDDFAEEIRKALWAARELWLLVSPNSLNSDWVISEWGAAWVLQKRIVPILHRCRPEELPDRIRRLHCIDFYKYPELIKARFQN